MWRRLSVWLLVGAGCAAFSGNLAPAQEAIGNAPGPENEQLPPNLPPSIASSIPELAQFKKGLLDLGYDFQCTYFPDGLGNPTGGVRQGAVYEGLLYMVLDADLAKIATWTASVFASALFKCTAVGCRRPTSSTLRRSTASRRGPRPGCSSFGPNRSSATWRCSASVNWRPIISSASANSATLCISTARSAGRRSSWRTYRVEDPAIRWRRRGFASN